MFGERLGWSVKEMWVNVLDTGGRQPMHNHANSFISGVVDLTPTHRDACTVFMKSPGGHDFAFRNDHAGAALGPYSADKWISPEPQPGDLVLFPSYLMHAVPPNPGERRIAMAFNAIPDAARLVGLPDRLRRLTDRKDRGCSGPPAPVFKLTNCAARLAGLSAESTLLGIPFTSARRPRRRGAALGVMAASGFAGLGYQIVWTQQGALWLGHEAAAVLAVVTAFSAAWRWARWRSATASSAVIAPSAGTPPAS